MKNSRFTEMLSVIKKEDHKRFSELVDSPFFNKNERVKKLWKWILENYISSPLRKESFSEGADSRGLTPLLDPAKQKSGTAKSAEGEGSNEQNFNFTKEDLIKAIKMDPSSAKADSGLEEANFRMVLSDFVRLVEIFLLLEGNDIIDLRRDALIDILKTNRLEKSYNKHLRVIRENAAAETNRDVTYYNNLYLIECEELGKGDVKNNEKSLKSLNGLTDFIWICMKLDGFIKSIALGIDVMGMSFFSEIIGKIESDLKVYRKDHSVIYSRYLVLKMFMHEGFAGNKYFAELEKYTAKLKDQQIQGYNYDALLTYCRMNEEYERESALMKKLEKKVKKTGSLAARWGRNYCV